MPTESNDLPVQPADATELVKPQSPANYRLERRE
jgi:hypothetical protein